MLTPERIAEIEHYVACMYPQWPARAPGTGSSGAGE